MRQEALATNELVNEIIDAYNAFLEAHKDDVPDAADAPAGETRRRVRKEQNDQQMDELFADLPATSAA